MFWQHKEGAHAWEAYADRMWQHILGLDQITGWDLTLSLMAFHSKGFQLAVRLENDAAG